MWDICSIELSKKIRLQWTLSPAKNSFSIISNDDDAGPNVASCFVFLRHRGLFFTLLTSLIPSIWSMTSSIRSNDDTLMEVEDDDDVDTDRRVDIGLNASADRMRRAAAAKSFILYYNCFIDLWEGDRIIPSPLDKIANGRCGSWDYIVFCKWMRIKKSYARNAPRRGEWH